MIRDHRSSPRMAARRRPFPLCCLQVTDTAGRRFQSGLHTRRRCPRRDDVPTMHRVRSRSTSRERASERARCRRCSALWGEGKSTGRGLPARRSASRQLNSTSACASGSIADWRYEAQFVPDTRAPNLEIARAAARRIPPIPRSRSILRSRWRLAAISTGLIKRSALHWPKRDRPDAHFLAPGSCERGAM